VPQLWPKAKLCRCCDQIRAARLAASRQSRGTR